MEGNNPQTVVVLEPDVVVRAEIGEHLRECGYRVIEGVEANDLRAFLQADMPVHVVLSEANLRRGQSGFELAQELRQTRPEIAVILVSSISNVAEKASDLCARNPVKKPYRPEEIVCRIQTLVAKRNLSGKAMGGKD